MATMKTILEKKGYNFWFVAPGDTLLKAIQRLQEKKVGALLVMDGDRLCGILSERDIVRLVGPDGTLPKDKQVVEVMTANVFGVRLGTSVDECMALMSEKQIRHVPVMDGHTVVGVVSNRDVVAEAIADRDNLIKGMDVFLANREFAT